MRRADARVGVTKDVKNTSERGGLPCRVSDRIEIRTSTVVHGPVHGWTCTVRKGSSRCNGFAGLHACHVSKAGQNQIL